MSIILAEGHHAEVTVNVEDEREDAGEWFEVEVAVYDLHSEVNREESQVEPLGVDPVRQVLNLVLKKRFFAKLSKYKWRRFLTVSKILNSR